MAVAHFILVRSMRMRSLVPLVIAVALITGCDRLSRPSEAEVRQLADQHSPNHHPIHHIEYGRSFISQGGSVELKADAPKGTKIFPVELYFTNVNGYFKIVAWVFKDSFGHWKFVFPNE